MPAVYVSAVMIGCLYLLSVSTSWHLPHKAACTFNEQCCSWRGSYPMNPTSGVSLERTVTDRSKTTLNEQAADHSRRQRHSRALRPGWATFDQKVCATQGALAQAVVHNREHCKLCTHQPPAHPNRSTTKFSRCRCFQQLQRQRPLGLQAPQQQQQLLRTPVQVEPTSGSRGILAAALGRSC